MTALTDERVVQLTNWIESRRGRHAPTDETRSRKIVNSDVLDFIKRYAESDRSAAVGERLAGEIYFLYFKATPETQRAFVESLCKAQRIPVPEADRTARQQLIVAVYGSIPGLIDDSEGDSKGGKRITWAIRTYEESIGLREPRKKRVREVFPRTSREFIETLREVAKPAELQILERLIARAYGKKVVSEFRQKNEEAA